MFCCCKKNFWVIGSSCHWFGLKYFFPAQVCPKGQCLPGVCVWNYKAANWRVKNRGFSSKAAMTVWKNDRVFKINCMRSENGGFKYLQDTGAADSNHWPDLWQGWGQSEPRVFCAVQRKQGVPGNAAQTGLQPRCSGVSGLWLQVPYVRDLPKAVSKPSILKLFIIIFALINLL